MSNDIVPENKKFLPDKKQEVDTDMQYTRENLYQLIETAMGGLEELVPVAQNSQNARAYEVLFNAIKTTAELNEKLADHSVKKEETIKEENKDKNEVTNQNLFVGTADQMQELLQLMKKNEK